MLTEEVPGENYRVLKESVFIEAIDMVKGRYYDDEIRSINDLEKVFERVINYYKKEFPE